MGYVKNMLLEEVVDWMLFEVVIVENVDFYGVFELKFV